MAGCRQQVLFRFRVLRDLLLSSSQGRRIYLYDCLLVHPAPSLGLGRLYMLPVNASTCTHEFEAEFSWVRYVVQTGFKSDAAGSITPGRIRRPPGRYQVSLEL
jgi:hypothetical protein